MGTTADKLQHLINGKQSIVNSVNNKASTNLTITSPWSTISQAIQGITTTVTTEEKTFTPTESVQTYTPTSGTYISKVTVNAIQTETKSVTPTTSFQTVTPTSGKYLKSVSVGAISTQTKSVTAGTSSTTVTPDSGKYLTSVTVAPTPSQSKTATPNTSSQTIKPDSGKLLSQVTVNAISTQTKTATPTTSSQTIKPDSGKYLTQVTVNAIPSTYKNTSDATAVAGDLLSGKTAYNSSGKITGTILSYDGTYEGNAGIGGEEPGGPNSESVSYRIVTLYIQKTESPIPLGDTVDVTVYSPTTTPGSGTYNFEPTTVTVDWDSNCTFVIPINTPFVFTVSGCEDYMMAGYYAEGVLEALVSDVFRGIHAFVWYPTMQDSPNVFSYNTFLMINNMG